MMSSLIKVYDVYDIESLFLLILKHLILSKGLNQLISLSRYQQERNIWRRNDDYLVELATQIFDQSSEE